MSTQRDLTEFATTAQNSEESSESEPMTTNTTESGDSTDTTTDTYECELCGDEPAENRLNDGDTMLCDPCHEEADGGRYDPSADPRGAKPWSDYEPGDEVLLIEKPAVGLMCAPDIIEGSISSSGKSVMIGPDEGLSSKTRRLDAATIMQGEWEFRDSTSYELYTPGRFRNTQRANHAPGPQAGANEVSAADDLPTPSHWPQTEQPDDAPIECPSCNRDPTHWQTEGKIRPMCEACGELLPEDDDQDDDQDETVEKWDLSRLDRGDVLTLDGHRGEFLLTRIHCFQGTQTVNKIEAATYDSGDGWTEYELKKINASGKQRLSVDRDDTDSSPFVDVDDESHARDFEKIRQDTELLRQFINECYYGNDDDRDDEGGKLVTDGGQPVDLDGDEIREMPTLIREAMENPVSEREAAYHTDQITERRGTRFAVSQVTGTVLAPVEPPLCHHCAEGYNRRSPESGVGCIGRVSIGYSVDLNEEYRFCSFACRTEWRDAGKPSATDTATTAVQDAADGAQTALDEFDQSDAITATDAGETAPRLIADGGRPLPEMPDGYEIEETDTGGVEVKQWSPTRRDISTRIEVPPAKRDLYHLLADVVERSDEERIRPTMPAAFAIECRTLVDVVDLLDTLHKGHVDAGGVGWGMGYVQALRRAIEDYRDRDPLTLVAVGCSGSKVELDAKVPARDLYTGTYWEKKRDYGKTLGDEWRIISAEHALLDPDEPTAYYERTPSDLEGVPVDVGGARLPNGDPVTTMLDLWALNVHSGLSAWIRNTAGGIDPRDVELEILLGKQYEQPLRERGVFDRLRAPASLQVSFPFRENQELTGIGKQMAWLGDRVDEHTDAAPDGGQLVADGGVFEREADGTTWCPECQRRRVNCAHQQGESA